MWEKIFFNWAEAANSHGLLQTLREYRTGENKLSNVTNLLFSYRERAWTPSTEISVLTFAVKKSTMKLSGVLENKCRPHGCPLLKSKAL